VQFWSFLLCIYGVVIVSEAETCQETAPELYKATARFAWTGFALAIACIITSLSTAIFVMLMRTGAITTSDAAPQGTLDLCRVVQVGDVGSPEDSKLLAPDDDGEAQTCPICMEVRERERAKCAREAIICIGNGCCADSNVHTSSAGRTTQDRVISADRVFVRG